MRTILTTIIAALVVLIAFSIIGCSKQNPVALPSNDPAVVPASPLGCTFSMVEINMKDTSMTFHETWAWRGTPTATKYQTEMFSRIINDSLDFFEKPSPLAFGTDSLMLTVRVKYQTVDGWHWHSETKTIPCVTINRKK